MGPQSGNPLLRDSRQPFEPGTTKRAPPDQEDYQPPIGNTINPHTRDCTDEHLLLCLALRTKNHPTWRGALRRAQFEIILWRGALRRALHEIQESGGSFQLPIQISADFFKPISIHGTWKVPLHSSWSRRSVTLQSDGDVKYLFENRSQSGVPTQFALRAHQRAFSLFGG